MTSRTTWYTKEHESAWDKVKAAFRNDWEQTKNDFGSEEARDLDQNVDDTVKQMLGKQSLYRYGDMEFDEMEPAFRYGYAARQHYGITYPIWDDRLQAELEQDYPGDWDRDRQIVRYSYNYYRPIKD